MTDRENDYFKDILSLFKEMSFHEIYVHSGITQMESCRKDLAEDENYDPHTAFKVMDHFKHNRVIAYELFSFFEGNRIESTVEECEQVIMSLDKSLTFMDYVRNSLCCRIVLKR